MKRRFLLIMLLFAASLSVSAQQRKAVVNLSVNNLREKPEYEAELGNQCLMGRVVEILDQSGCWIKVQTDDPYTAWCVQMSLVEMTGEEIREYESAPKYIYVGWCGSLWISPSEKSTKLMDVVEGDLMRICLKDARPIVSGKWAKVQIPDGRQGWVLRRDIMEYGAWQKSCLARGEDIVKQAMKYVGLPYLWGGTSPRGVDCSGLSSRVFAMNGLHLPRNASQQAKCGELVPGSFHCLEPHTIDFEPGDLLFFGSWKDDGSPRVSHVAISLGGSLFIHSAQVVRINSLDPESGEYYSGSTRFLFARRILR